MTFESPEWILLAPLFAVLGWQARMLRLQRPIRALCCGLMTLLLMGPRLQHASKGLDLWVLIDRSDSARGLVDPNLAEWESILKEGRTGENRLRFIDFARDALPRAGNELTAPVGGGGHTRLGLAIQSALMHRDPQRATKLLALTDGYFTDSLAIADSGLQREGVALEWRLRRPPAASDASVRSLVAPQRARASESFLVEARIDGPSGLQVPYALYRNGEEAKAGVVELKNGYALLQFSDRAAAASALSYALVIAPAGDPIAGNNKRVAWTQIEGKPRVLILTNFESDPVEQALANGGFEVDAIRDTAKLGVGSLTGVSVVIFNNVPANRIPNAFLEGLDFFVREQGGGLLMLGGAYSFGSGGYYSSALDGLLPVSMELKNEHKKLAVAMAIVVDRSGSMGAPVQGHLNLTKMDLANAGAAQATQLLGELDAMAYVAVDTDAHVIVPLTDVGENRGSIVERINRVASMGGGIYVHVGLNAGWQQLQRSPFGQRHLILFADASDAEEPGSYKDLLAEMVDGKATVSVIALGAPTDPDAELLRDVARRGGGRIFFNANAADLPALFTQETVAVARSSFIEEALETRPTAGWLEVSGQPMDWLPLIGGYNLSYLRDGATMALASGDEYQAPLVAFWQQGIGRAAAVTFPLSGKFSALSVNWPGYGDFAQTLTRWLMGERQLDGLSYESVLEGDTLTLDLYFDANWQDRFSQHPPRALLHQDRAAKEMIWQRIEPGRYQARERLETSGSVARGAITLGDRAIPFGPFATGGDEEWHRDPEKLEQLTAAAKRSGGAEIMNLDDAWRATALESERPLRPWIACALLAALLIDVAETRLGISVFGKARQIGRWRRGRGGSL